jgi:hypothetical protein
VPVALKRLPVPSWILGGDHTPADRQFGQHLPAAMALGEALEVFELVVDPMAQQRAFRERVLDA